jgi:hypothetical protein
MAYPSRHVAELVHLGAPHGIEYEGIGGSGHAKFRLPTGEVYSTAASPSDRNATKQAWRDIAEKIGVPLEKVKSGKYRRGVSTATAVRHIASEADVERGKEVAALKRKHRGVCEQIRAIQSDGNGAQHGPRLVKVLLSVEEKLLRWGEQPPPRTFRYHQ